MNFVEAAVREHEKENLEADRDKMRELEAKLAGIEGFTDVNADSFRVSILTRSPHITFEKSTEAYQIAVATDSGGVMLGKFSFKTQEAGETYLATLKEWGDLRQRISQNTENYEDPPLQD